MLSGLGGDEIFWRLPFLCDYSENVVSQPVVECLAAEMKTVYDWVLGAGDRPDCVLLN